MVLFASDNGGVSSLEWKRRPVTSNLPLRQGKGHLYDGGIRVPTIVRWPGVTKAGSRSDEVVVAYDYAPTIAEMAGVPKSKSSVMDGLSITSLLKGGAKLKRTANYWHYPHYSPQLGRPSAAIRQGDYKLILFFEDNRAELYNLKQDISEAKNLADLQPAKTLAMRKQLEDWLKKTGAQLPVANPNYNPSRELELGTPEGPTTAK